MALLHSSSPFLLSSNLRSLEQIHTTLLTTSFSFSSSSSSSCYNNYTQRGALRRSGGKKWVGECWAAVVDGIQEEEVLHPKEAEQVAGTVEYDWREEWYPLYLSTEVPDDAALGLTVFDKQIVLYRDAEGVLRCHEDRCPHRLAKLSEGQLVNGNLECLYHGWQFDGEGKCVKIPQLPSTAKIPRNACTKSYHVRDSQGVVWVWMSDKSPPNPDKLPLFPSYSLPGFQDLSTIHELPYDHSILLENLMDPAHVPISHDRTDWTAKREDAQPLTFHVTERTPRGFAGQWARSTNPALQNFLRFQAPCVLSNSLEFTDKNGVKQCFSALFLCRPSGQGKSMLIVRFGSTTRSFLAKVVPKWFLHQNAGKVFEQDMGFLSSQNEVLVKENLPTKELYLNLKSSDTWVVEYRKWMDKVGHGMPYYFGHGSLRLPEKPAVVEQAPAGLVAGVSASFPAKGGVGSLHAPNLANRYYRHVVHCKGCRGVVRKFQVWKDVLSAVAAVALAAAVLASGRRWKVGLVVASGVLVAGSYAFASVVEIITTNFIRTHRRL